MCGQPPVSTPMMRSAGERFVADEELRVLLGVDVVGDDGDLDSGRAARGRARASARSCRSRPGRRCRREAVAAVAIACHERNSRVYCVSWRAHASANPGANVESRRRPRHRGRRDAGIRAPSAASMRWPATWPSGTIFIAAQHLVLEPRPEVRSRAPQSAGTAKPRAASANAAGSVIGARLPSRRGPARRRGRDRPRASRASHPSARSRPELRGFARRAEPCVPARERRPVADAARPCSRHDDGRFARARRRAPAGRRSSLGAGRIVDRALADGPLEPLRIAVGADRQRRARELQQARDGVRSMRSDGASATFIAASTLRALRSRG